MKDAAIYLWRGQALVIGGSMDTRPHAHHAAQLTLALSGEFHIRRPRHETTEETTGPLTFAALPPDELHAIDGRSAQLAYLFVDAGSRADGRWLAVASATAPEPALQGALRRLAQQPDPVEAGQLVRRWRAHSMPAWERPPVFDRRIDKALAWLDAHPDAEPNHAGLADVVALSPSRFAHLFKEHTGQSLSRYLLWRRLLAATARLAAGANVTEAALDTGFADTAHMSRAFHATFGVTPSDFVRAKVWVQPTDEPV